MRDSRCAQLATIVALSTVMVANALAQGRFSYEAPVGCPDTQGFLNEVRQRSTSHANVQAWSPETNVRVAIEDVAPRFVGVLEIGGMQRKVAGNSCEEVVSALALVLSLAPLGHAEVVSGPTRPVKGQQRRHSPTANGDLLAVPEPPLSLPPAPVPVAAAPTVQNVAPSQALPAPVVEIKAKPLEESVPVTPVTAAHPVDIWVGAGFQTVLSPAPNLMWGPALDFTVVRPWRGIWSTGLHAQLAVAAAKTQIQADGGGDFRWAAVRLEYCPLYLRSDAFRFVTCAGGAAGVLDVSGQANGRIVTTANVKRPWFDASASFKISWALTQHWAAGFGASVLAPITRDAFEVVVGPNMQSAVHTAPPIGAVLGIAVSYETSR